MLSRSLCHCSLRVVFFRLGSLRRGVAALLLTLGMAHASAYAATYAVYVVNRDSMGKFNPTTDNVYEKIGNAFPAGVYSMPAYFNGTVYYGGVTDHIKSFPINNAMLALGPSQQTTTSFIFPGSTPSISANVTSNAILWAVENATTAVLHAYDAYNLSHELYNSNQSGTRDNFGAGNKFITPMIANGKVFVGTPTGVAVFGLLP
jgi:hypothetical protein